MRIRSFTRAGLLLLLPALIAGCAGTPTTTRLPTATPPAPYPILSTSGQATGTPVPGGGPQALSRATPDPVLNPVYIAGVIYDGRGGETIIVKNASRSEQSLAYLSLFNPGTTDHLDFPAGLTLQPGASLTVWNGPKTGKPEGALTWLDIPALQLAGDELELLNPAGRVIWVYTK